MPTSAHRPVTRFGLQINSFTYPGVADADLFERIAQIAGTAERSGFDSVWVMDHLYQIAVVGKRTEPMLEAYSLLCAIAARTSRAQLGTMVTGVTYRNPALLAKMVTTLDVISGGRAILGIGAAWNDDEHNGYGFEFPPLRERFDRLEDAVQICRAMFTQEAPTFTGTTTASTPSSTSPGPCGRRPPDPDRRQRRAAHDPDGRPLCRRVQLLRRRRDDPAQGGRARGGVRADRPRPGRDHEDAPRTGQHRRDPGRGRAQRQAGGRGPQPRPRPHPRLVHHRRPRLGARAGRRVPRGGARRHADQPARRARPGADRARGPHAGRRLGSATAV